MIKIIVLHAMEHNKETYEMVRPALIFCNVEINRNENVYMGVWCYGGGQIRNEVI